MTNQIQSPNDESHSRALTFRARQSWSKLQHSKTALEFYGVGAACRRFAFPSLFCDERNPWLAERAVVAVPRLRDCRSSRRGKYAMLRWGCGVPIFPQERRYNAFQQAPGKG